MKRLKIRETGPLSLEMKVPGGKTERLAITDPFYPRTEVAVELFRSLGTMELVAPYLPDVIETERALDAQVAHLIDDMYRSCEKKGPGFVLRPHTGSWDLRNGGRTRAIISYSAGKDSLHSMMWAQERWGAENVMAVHISGLNSSCAKGERDFSFRQAERLQFPHFRTVRLLSSGMCTRNGYEVMRSRDFFMTGILVPIALQFGAKYIVTEGFEEADGDEPYTGQEQNMNYFNETLRRLGLPVQVVWKNLPEMDVFPELYENRPGWMAEVHNCFAIACRKGNWRKSWNGPRGRTRSWPLYDSQCGSCVKCRITRLGQLMYDEEGMAGVKPDEIRVFLKDTVRYTISEWKKWLKGERNHRDMLADSFIRDLGAALRARDMLGLTLKLVAELKHCEQLAKAAKNAA